ncbi:MAG: RluA family pseudouridine synthase [Oceanipulchritudo sp.]
MTAPRDEELQLTVPEGHRPGRADKLLAALYPDLSRSRWQKLFHAGRVWREDEVLSQKDKLRPGDVVNFSLPPLEPMELRPVPMQLEVLFEDKDLLVIDKEPGRVVHPGAGTGEDTLVHGILHHCHGQLSGIGGTERPGIVHRLDKETSGVLVAAKSDAAFRGLSEQFASRVVRKYYTALVRGVPEPERGRVEEPVGRHPVQRTRMTCRADGRPARTDYEVRRTWNRAASMAWIRIHTGRTHQIRVHLKHLGHPLLGDTLYGCKDRFPRAGGTGSLPGVPRVMLHATRLEFIHPVEGIPLRIEAPLPADFRSVMADLDKLFPAGKSR